MSSYEALSEAKDLVRAARQKVVPHAGTEFSPIDRVLAAMDDVFAAIEMAQWKQRQGQPNS